MKTGVHITHEAVQKLGGIRTVIQGLVTSEQYKKYFSRTLLYTPLFDRNCAPELRLGRNAAIHYSGFDGISTSDLSDRFREVENKYGVHIIYGKKDLFKSAAHRGPTETVDILAIDAWDMPADIVNLFKFELWERYGIQSEKFANDHDYEQYLRIGIVLKDLLEILYGENSRNYIFSHEYMGLPSALAVEISKSKGHKNNDVTVFYAHEVSTARAVVEAQSGHDISFYNILKIDKKLGISLEDEYGSFSNYSRSELVKCAQHLDYIFAVSDITREEFEYLCPEMDKKKIKVVYNGVPTEKISFKEKQESINKIKQYCVNLFDFEPDHIFTHVTRLVTSKGMWRDIRFLYYLDEHFTKHNLKGFFVILSTLIGSGRPKGLVHQMVKDYNWPVTHKEGWPDLVGFEIDLYRYLEIFNFRSKSIKGVFLNQFGFNRDLCGDSVPENTNIHDLRLASDVEFGLSVYEPFGIAQLENMPYGGLPVLSTSCGCEGLLKNNFATTDYVSVDFIDIPEKFASFTKDKDSLKHISIHDRDEIEIEICKQSAGNLISLLPSNDKAREKRLARMQRKCAVLDWEHVSKRMVGLLKRV